MKLSEEERRVEKRLKKLIKEEKAKNNKQKPKPKKNRTIYSVMLQKLKLKKLKKMTYSEMTLKKQNPHQSSNQKKMTRRRKRSLLPNLSLSLM